MKLSLIIPCYNEKDTLLEALEAVLSLRSETLDVEAVVVDDCSTDGSLALLEEFARDKPNVVVLKHDVNRGKGAALRTGFLGASGDFIGIHDADSEYTPSDYLKMLAPLAGGRAEVVYGSRYFPSEERRVLRYWHSRVNAFLTMLSNMLSDLSVSDMETCYKLFKRDVLLWIVPNLVEDRFGFEPEVTAWVAKGARKQGWRVVECPISYRPRTFREGKKIGWTDGVRALWCIVKYNVFR